MVTAFQKARSFYKRSNFLDHSLQSCKTDWCRVNGNQPCILIWDDGVWDEDVCSAQHKIICEIDGNALSPTGTVSFRDLDRR
jgi:hypothetical protein